MKLAASHHGREFISATSTERRAACDGEWNVTAELSCECEQLFARRSELPQRIACNQRARSVCATASHAARNWNALGDVQVHLRLDACMLREKFGGPPREIARAVACELSTFAFAGESQNVVMCSDDIVVKIDCLVHRLDRMETVGVESAYFE